MRQSPRSNETLILAVAESLPDAPAAKSQPAEKLFRLVSAPPITAGFLDPPIAAGPGEALQLTLILDIAKGYHIYGPEPGAKFLKPTSLTFESNPVGKMDSPVWPKMKTITDPALDKPVNVYEGRVTLRLPMVLAADAKPGPAEFKWTLRVQACDEKQCYSPQSLSLSLPLKITPPPR